jgi:hypothetical protein
MSNGMCCSASHWICSSSWASLIIGIVIFRMITLCPETLTAHSFWRIFASLNAR